MDVRIGGQRKICMQMTMPERTMTMWFVGEYLEVEAPTRLVYTESMADADGNLISPQSMGMPEGHPQLTQIRVELTPKSGHTHMKMTHQGVPSDSQGAGGWRQAIEKLAELLAA